MREQGFTQHTSITHVPQSGSQHGSNLQAHRVLTWVHWSTFSCRRNKADCCLSLGERAYKDWVPRTGTAQTLQSQGAKGRDDSLAAARAMHTGKHHVCQHTALHSRTQQQAGWCQRSPAGPGKHFRLYPSYPRWNLGTASVPSPPQDCKIINCELHKGKEVLCDDCWKNLFGIKGCIFSQLMFNLAAELLLTQQAWEHVPGSDFSF